MDAHAQRPRHQDNIQAHHQTHRLRKSMGKESARGESRRDLSKAAAASKGAIGWDRCALGCAERPSQVSMCNIFLTFLTRSTNGLFPSAASGKEQSGLLLGNNVFAVGVAERAEGFKMSWRIDRVE